MKYAMTGAAVLALLAMAALPASLRTAASPDTSAAASRSFELTYVVHVPALPAGAKQLRLWIPLPYHEKYQTIEHEKIESPVPYHIYSDSEYHNRYAYVDVSGARGDKPFDITISLHARRYERRVPLVQSDRLSGVAMYNKARFLQPDRLVPSNPQLTAISDQVTQGTTGDVQKARELYNYVIAHMHYDHDGTEWGRGDAVWACDSHHGNCTDFHSLFIALARAQSIPAAFEIGFPLPADKHEGAITSYHCWALFYANGIGWVPIDASEAWKHKDKEDYFFGAIDANRIKMSLGRDIVLTPAQKGAPLNYFVNPYAELDGQIYKDVKTDYSFRDDPAPAGGATANGSD